MQLPSYSIVSHPGTVCLVMTIMLTIVTISGRTGDVYCIYYPDTPPNEDAWKVYVLLVAMVLPVYSPVLVMLATHHTIASKLASYHNISHQRTQSLSTELIDFLVVVYQMMSYGLAFSLGFSPSMLIAALYAMPGKTDSISHVLAPISAVCLSLTGTATALLYFRFQSVHTHRYLLLYYRPPWHRTLFTYRHLHRFFHPPKMSEQEITAGGSTSAEASRGSWWDNASVWQEKGERPDGISHSVDVSASVSPIGFGELLRSLDPAALMRMTFDSNTMDNSSNGLSSFENG
jgi:hypothetical protein